MPKKRRSSRIKNWSLGDVYFIPAEHNIEYLPKRIPLANMSGSGLGLWIQDSRVYLPPGLALSGKVDLGEASFPVHLEVVRQNKFVYGCRFLQLKEDLAHFLHTHFYVEENADHLVRIKSELLASKEEGRPFWYSDGISELYFIESPSDKTILQYRLVHGKHEVYKYHGGSPYYEREEKSYKLSDKVYDEFLRFLRHINELSFEYRQEVEKDLKSLL